MAERTKRLAAVLAALAVVVLGFDKIGGVEVAPGPDLGFSCSAGPLPRGHTLSLATDKGDLRCFVRLRLRTLVAAPIPGRLGAHLSNGTPLRVWLRSSGSNSELALSIYSPGPAGGKFLWPSGVYLRIVDPDHALVGAKVDDWSVFLSDNQRDSWARARWRAVWLWVCRFLAFVAVTSVAVTTLRKDAPRPPFTPEACVAHMIDGIEGGSAKETEKLRAVLKKVVLEGAPAAEARDSLGGSSTERMQLWFKARSRLLAHLDHLLESLSRYRADLNG